MNILLLLAPCYLLVFHAGHTKHAVDIELKELKLLEEVFGNVEDQSLIGKNINNENTEEYNDEEKKIAAVSKKNLKRSNELYLNILSANNHLVVLFFENTL